MCITSGSFCCAGSVGLSRSPAVGLVEPAHWPPADHQLQSVKKKTSLEDRCHMTRLHFKPFVSRFEPGCHQPPLTPLKTLLMALATRGLLLWASRSNITDSSFCCTFWSPRAEKNGLVICRETTPQRSDATDSLRPTFSTLRSRVFRLGSPVPGLRSGSWEYCLAAGSRSTEL